MSRRCCHHHKENRRHHDDLDHHPGVVRRTTRGLANKFGVPRKLVLAGFIVGLVMNPPLAIFLFLVALYWVDHPGKLERLFSRTADKVRGTTSGGRHSHTHAFAGAHVDDEETIDPDLEFRDLRRQFDELERRAGQMEEHVASDEFQINRELGRMQPHEDPKL